MNKKVESFGSEQFLKSEVLSTALHFSVLLFYFCNNRIVLNLSKKKAYFPNGQGRETHAFSFLGAPGGVGVQEVEAEGNSWQDGTSPHVLIYFSPWVCSLCLLGVTPCDHTVAHHGSGPRQSPSSSTPFLLLWKLQTHSGAPFLPSPSGPTSPLPVSLWPTHPSHSSPSSVFKSADSKQYWLNTTQENHYTTSPFQVLRIQDTVPSCSYYFMSPPYITL